MSASLAFTPVLPEPEHDTLPDKLKYLFRDKFNLGEGGHILNMDNLPYLEGIRDGGIPEIQPLIDCIKKHGGAHIFLNY